MDYQDGEGERHFNPMEGSAGPVTGGQVGALLCPGRSLAQLAGNRAPPWPGSLPGAEALGGALSSCCPLKAALVPHGSRRRPVNRVERRAPTGTSCPACAQGEVGPRGFPGAGRAGAGPLPDEAK